MAFTIITQIGPGKRFRSQLALACSLVFLASCREAPKLADETVAPDSGAAPHERYHLEGTNVVTQGAIHHAWNGEADQLGLWDGATEEDKVLSRRVHVVLSTDTMGVTGAIDVKLLNKFLQVHTENGVVTLRGKVRSEKEKANMEATAAALDGVAEVRNELQVDPSVPRDSIRDEIQQFTDE
jgi:hypothetical protein